MRFIVAALTFVAVLCGSVSVQAETQIFISANDPDGYGVDRCLATGARCGAAVATAYCRSREFTQAASFRRVEREEITGTIPVGVAKTEEFVAIECSRERVPATKSARDIAQTLESAIAIEHARDERAGR
jgi:hypothetical protein